MMLIRCSAVLLLTTLAARAQTAKPTVWEMESSGTTAGLRGVHAVGGGVVWASGEHGTVLRTEDSGYMWQSCAMPPGAEKLDFRGVWAWDANTAIVMSSGPGDMSRLYKTTDGCSHWTLLYTNPDKEGFWDAIQFGVDLVPNPRATFTSNGVLIGDPVQGKFAIFLTFDAGEHWYRWGRSQSMKDGVCGEHQASSRRDEALFAASNQALLVKADASSFLFVTGGKQGGRLLTTDFFSMDGPPCWTSIDSQSLPLGGGASSGAFAVATKSWTSNLPDELVIVGGDYARPDETHLTALSGSPRTFTLFGGAYDIDTATTPPGGYRSAVAWDADDNIWITVGPNGSDYSADDGNTWQPLEHAASSKPGEWNALSLPWAVGPNGRIAKLNSDALPPGARAATPKSSK